ncbi:BspA family leucine-rich repeat surface protein [Candidatus Francisella endociliophora]|uniref:BspA family leucine-rich repeat surface protein n=1 Tax=Candidatus Francisella endociliophora TaxID=653937 RepID=UPI000694A761|nr:BspA family leucine-rich repeat surface protein [Francisella sp. FSC1006]
MKFIQPFFILLAILFGNCSFANLKTIICKDDYVGSEVEHYSHKYLVVDNNTLRESFRDFAIGKIHLCTSHVTDMSHLSNLLSNEALYRNLPIGITSWDTSNVTTMEGMFENLYSFNQNIGDWDTSKVKDMSQMFKNAYSFNYDINKWNVSSVDNMTAMFFNAHAFNKPLDKWDISNVVYTQDMFNGAYSFNQDISHWDTSNIVIMNNMFYDAKSFNQDISSWDVSMIKSRFRYSFANKQYLDADNWPIFSN